ncbi:MAG: hypothetical protein ACRDZN_02010 [Acidimicrobiales bacterium]
MRRLILLVVVALMGLAVYRRRTLDRWERELRLGGRRPSRQ